MLKRIVCLLVTIACLLPAMALAKTYDSIKIFEDEIDIKEIIFKAGDRFTTGNGISVVLYYADVYGNEIERSNSTVKTVTIDGEKISEWRLTETKGSVMQLGHIYSASYGFTLKPPYAASDNEGYYTLQSKTYNAFTENARNKKVKFTGDVVSKNSNMFFISIAKNDIVAIQSDAVLGRGDHVFCKGVIKDYFKYHKTIVPVIVCDEAKVQQYEPLQKGDKGIEVIQMKERLQSLGYFRAGAELSDTYNDTCVERVQQFQQNNGLPATGVADADTLTLLYSNSAKEK